MSHDPSNVIVRAMGREDLAEAMAIQLESYPAFLCEHEDAFASRLDVPHPYCLAATLDGKLVGYLLAHGWQSQSPPAIGAVLSRDVPGEVLFIHDLALSRSGRTLGIGRKLIMSAFKAAASDGLKLAELIAVEGAARYWQTLGFAEVAISSALAAKVASYGADARWMTREIVSYAPVG